MILEYFVAIVGALAVVYAGISKFLQNKLIDRTKVEKFQAKTNKLNEEMKKAKERGNQTEIDDIMKKQIGMMSESKDLMIDQFKPMIAIIAVFICFTSLVGFIDPTVKDDFSVSLYDNGLDCDKTADDKVFSGCVGLNSTNYGKWTITAKSYRNGAEVGSNSTFFSYVTESDDSYIEAPHGESLILETDKNRYNEGDRVVLYANANSVNEVKATLDYGTHFRVDLPLSIPILNINRIYQPYWWFIMISLISNIVLSLVLNKQKKKEATS